MHYEKHFIRMAVETEGGSLMAAVKRHGTLFLIRQRLTGLVQVHKSADSLARVQQITEMER